MGKVTRTVKTVKTRTVKTVTTTTTTSQLLKFGHGNAKLGKEVWTFSLPAGWFCPSADKCLSRADRKTGRITDGPNTEFRCFSASGELRTNVRAARWHNARLLKRRKTVEQIADLILRSLDVEAEIVRLHVSGDFYTQDYFDAWMKVAQQRPDTSFYGYSKSLAMWLNFIARMGSLPGNVILTASYGGKDDHLIEQHNLRSARVVFSQAEADSLGLEIDHDDSHAMKHGPSFALLIHGVQPAGTPAAKALFALRAQGDWGYGEKADKRRVSLHTVN